MSAKEGWYAAEYVVPYPEVKAPLAPTDQERKEAAEDRIYQDCLNHGKPKAPSTIRGGTHQDDKVTAPPLASGMTTARLRECYKCHEFTYVGDKIRCLNPVCQRTRMRECKQCKQKTYVGHRMTDELRMSLCHPFCQKRCMNPQCFC